MDRNQHQIQFRILRQRSLERDCRVVRRGIVPIRFFMKDVRRTSLAAAYLAVKVLSWLGIVIVITAFYFETCGSGVAFALFCLVVTSMLLTTYSFCLGGNRVGRLQAMRSSNSIVSSCQKTRTTYCQKIQTSHWSTKKRGQESF